MIVAGNGMEVAVVADGVRKSYDGRPVLRDVSFTVASGTITAILGPNGAGKTTMVEILEGYRHADGGSAFVLGHDPRRPGSSFRSQVGVVLQETRHDPYLTVAETVALTAGWYQEPLGVEEVLTTVGLTASASTRTAKLSGGQQRRLDVALGLVGRPRLLFLDEPTTGFDPLARREAWAMIADLRDQGTTVVLTTHYLDEAESLADEMVVLSGGTVVAAGPPGEIGGRDCRTTVAFRLDDAVLDRPPGGGNVDGTTWRTTVEDATAIVHRLSEWANSHDTTLHDLSIEHPSLEDVYLELTAP